MRWSGPVLRAARYEPFFAKATKLMRAGWD